MQPLVQRIGDSSRLALPYRLALVGVEVVDLALDARTALEELQRLLADLAAVVDPQLVELAPRVRHAADLGHALARSRPCSR